MFERFILRMLGLDLSGEQPWYSIIWQSHDRKKPLRKVKLLNVPHLKSQPAGRKGHIRGLPEQVLRTVIITIYLRKDGGSTLNIKHWCCIEAVWQYNVHHFKYWYSIS